MTQIDLNPSAPHSPERTKELGRAFNDVMTALAYGCQRFRGGLSEPGDVYDLLADLRLGLEKMPPLTRRISHFLTHPPHQNRLVRDDGGDAAADVEHALACLSDAERAACVLADSLRLAQNAISHVASAGKGGR